MYQTGPSQGSVKKQYIDPRSLPMKRISFKSYDISTWMSEVGGYWKAIVGIFVLIGFPLLLSTFYDDMAVYYTERRINQPERRCC